MPPVRTSKSNSSNISLDAIKFYDPARRTRAQRTARQNFTVAAQAAADSRSFCYYQVPSQQSSSNVAPPSNSPSVSPSQSPLPPPLVPPVSPLLPVPSVPPVSPTPDPPPPSTPLTAPLSTPLPSSASVTVAAVSPGVAVAKKAANSDEVFEDIWEHCINFSVSESD
ncbi:uncharacterized protein F5891DRAFT_1196972 [Suillus fuscotomentosus]|uniref:Uncharacterized protein n=1 Tax=Suillus fuscotomentosus TaxID=1912939 RepID=A0AAD4DSJ8_9AGAM|nr:uncharacterized protein F5891DRAFT_1196972 [Suillus fuscotomentosus]KAG1893004.1 hypothetical protein F5891DRAFT_1196972 [Suillus fuscotomentosus]